MKQKPNDKIYTFYIEKYFVNKEKSLYLVRLKCEYRNWLFNYTYGYNDFLTPYGERTEHRSLCYSSVNLDDIYAFIEYVVKKYNFKYYDIKNY